MSGNTTSEMLQDVDGAIPRIENRPKQLEFARRGELDVVMLDTYRAEKLLEDGDTAGDLFPGSTIILTTTFEDERLELWFLERELETAVKFGADVVIPCDIPVYEHHARRRRIADTRTYAENVTRAVEKFREYGIVVLPLVKGTTEYERRICYEAFEAAGISFVAYYCAQYFLYGYHYYELLHDVRDVVREFDPQKLMLIGLQSENLLQEFPPAVQAAAGFRWFRRSGLADNPLSVAIHNYAIWEQEVNHALRGGQKLLNSYASQPTYGGL